MAQSLFIHRILLIVPAAKVAAVVTWFQNNVGINSVDANLGPALNHSGLVADPVTHRWCCGSFIEADAKAILIKLCQLAGVAPPTSAVWDGWTGPQKRAWLHSVQTALRTGYGIHVGLADNLDQWDDPVAALTVSGLKTVVPAAA